MGEELKTSEYDENDNLKFYKNFTRLSDSVDWDLNSIYEYIYEYDENNFLISRKLEQTTPLNASPSLLFSFEYKNSCVGIHESAEGDHGSRIIREEYTYEGINECLDLENLDLNLFIYPNPSDGNIKLTSSIFQTGNTDISVFSTDGKVLLQTKEISRCESSSIDLSFLPNGLYILHLSNGDHFVNEKIVIAK